MRRLFIALLLLLCWLSPSWAATCTWSGGTGSWNNSNTASWSCGHVPTTADTVVFDGTSGGGTVTVDSPNAAGSVTVLSITCGAFTGTLDFSVNNNSATLSGPSGFNGSGTGARTVKLGIGTFTLSGTGNWNFGTTTNLTFNAGSSTISLSGNIAGQRTFSGGGLTYSTVSFGGNTTGNAIVIGAANNTFATLNISPPNAVEFPAGNTQTITNAFTWTGTSTNQIYILSGSLTSTGAISVSSGSPTMSWAGVAAIAFSGGATFTATNSFNLGMNTGIAITAPSTSGGGYVIGGL